VEEGDVYGFLGPNGSGKSTSIRMILSLIKPTSGKIKLFNKEVSFQKNSQINRIGALIETPDFYKYLSARRNLKILGKLSGVEPLNQRVDEVLDIVGLSGRGNSKVKAFSKGMKQRLGIAQAILHKPDLIILDEPTAGLDPQGQKEIRALINSLREDKNVTILISSHILFEIEQIANRMIIINKGKSLVEGSVSDLIHNKQHQVNYRISDPLKTQKLISESQWSSKITGSDGEKFNLQLKQAEIPEFTSFLTNMGCKIYAIEPIRSLEEYFLQITENETAG
jgi:ABC-2 type transport system ATP-binding protein